jgi:hypothetical protein
MTTYGYGSQAKNNNLFSNEVCGGEKVNKT